MKKLHQVLSTSAVAMAMVVTFVPMGQVAFAGGGDGFAPVAFAASVTNKDAVTVTGQGKVTVPADLATISINLEGHGSSAKDAYAQLSTQTKKIADVMAEYGVEKKDIVTTWSSFYPVMQYDEKGMPTKPSDYTATRSVNVNFRKLDQIDTAVDKLASNDIVNIGSITYSLENRDAAVDKARVAAAQDAAARVAKLAGVLGIKTGRIVSVNEMDNSYGYYPQTSVGNVDVTLALEVSYEIVQ